MTSEECIEAALTAFGDDDIERVEYNYSVLTAFAPELAAEVLRLRAELTANDSVFQTTMRELAELRRWRDPVSEPPLESGFYLCKKDAAKECLYFDGEWNEWSDDDDNIVHPTGWLPLPEVGS